MARRPETIGNFAADLVTSLGGKPTKQSTDLFNSWQRWEGGWTNNDATFNPLNLTAPGSGLPTINSVGVVAIPTYQAGVKRTSDLIRSGYPSIAKALATGRVDFRDPGLQADLNRWLSGKRTPGMTPYVSKIASSFGQPGIPMSAATPGVIPSTPEAAATSSSSPFLNPFKLSKGITQQFLKGGGTIDLTALPGVVHGAWQTPKPSPGTSSQRPRPATPSPAGTPGGGNWSDWVGTVQQRKGPSAPHTAAILQFVGQVGQQAGTVLTPWGNESHSLTTVNGNRSAHADGNAADIPATGAELIRLGRAALIAAGMPAAQANKQTGGLFNVGGKQVIFNTHIGGDHTNHVHVGLRG